MGWTPRFLRAISDAYAEPRFLLEEVRIATGDKIGGRWAIQSHAGPNPQAIGAEVADSLGSYVVAPSFGARFGQFSVPLTGDIGWLLDRITRGQIVRLRMGFRGWREYEYETIAVGQVWQLRGGRGRWTLECRDLLSALGARRTIDATKAALFSDAGTATTLSSAYTPGDATLALTSASGFAVPVSASAPGAVVVTPTTGDPFVLTYTGVSGASLTGCSSTAVYGTTAAAATSGKAAVSAGWYGAHPATSVLRALVSTGTLGRHGAHDLLPAEWGYALPPTLVDADDALRLAPWWSPGTGSTSWGMLATSAQANGGAWLLGELGYAGGFLAMRQGAITARPVIVPGAISSSDLAVRAYPEIADEITPADIVAVSRWEAWAADYQVEYRTTTITSTSGSTSRTETVATVPAVSAVEIDVGGRAYANESGWRSNISRRLGAWYDRVPEFVELELAGHRHAALAPGDVVRVTADDIPGRLPTTEGGYYRRQVVVSGVSPQWFGASTIITGYALPTKQDGF